MFSEKFLNISRNFSKFKYSALLLLPFYPANMGKDFQKSSGYYKEPFQIYSGLFLFFLPFKNAGKHDKVYRKLPRYIKEFFKVYSGLLLVPFHLGKYGKSFQDTSWKYQGTLQTQFSTIPHSFIPCQIWQQKFPENTLISEETFPNQLSNLLCTFLP